MPCPFEEVAEATVQSYENSTQIRDDVSDATLIPNVQNKFQFVNRTTLNKQQVTNITHCPAQGHFSLSKMSTQKKVHLEDESVNV